MKKKGILYLIAILIDFLVFDNVYATNYNSGRDNYSTQNCRFSHSQSTSKIRLSLSNSSETIERFGYIFGHKDVDGTYYFCINPGLLSDNLYDMQEAYEVGEDYHYYYSVETQNAMKNVYRWYLNNRVAYGENAFVYAQAVIWYIAEKRSTSLNRDDVVKAVQSVFYTSHCGDMLEAIRRGTNTGGPSGFNNNNFSCSCFMTDLNSTSAPRSCGDEITTGFDRNDPETARMARAGKLYQGNTELVNGKYRYVTLDRYIQVASSAGVAYSNVTSAGTITTVTDSIMNVVSGRNPLYGEDHVYFFVPQHGTARYQILIGLKGCKSGGNSCKIELDDLLERYDNANTRANNTAYVNELKQIQRNNNTAIPASRLNYYEFLKNPYCGKSCTKDAELYNRILRTNETQANEFKIEITSLYGTLLKWNADGTVSCDESSCEEDLTLLETYKTTNPTEASRLYFEMIAKYPTFNGNFDYPKCEGGTSAVCTPEIVLSDCDFAAITTGFEMKDSSLDMCWKENNIAFNTDTLEEKSKWEEASNDFCSIYCYEEFASEFPGGKAHVKAGQELFWGMNQPTGLFGSINAKRKCYTKNINYASFEEEFIKNEYEILDTYNLLLAQIEFNKETPYSDGSCDLPASDQCVSEDYPGGWSGGHACGTEELDFCTGPDDYIDDKGERQPANKSVCHTTSTGGCYWGGSYTQGGTNSCASCKSGYRKSESGSTCVNPNGVKCKLDGKTATSNGIDNDPNHVGSVSDKSDCFAVGTNCSEVTSLYEDIESTEKTLEDLLKKRQSLIAMITNCESNLYINENTIYTYITELSLIYKDPASSNNRNISGSSLLKLCNETPKQFSMTPGMLIGNVYQACMDAGSFTEDNKFGCTITNSFQIPKYSDYTWDFSGEWNYCYDPDIFTWKMLVETSYAYNTATYRERYGDFFALDGTYGFMTSFKLKTDFYEFAEVQVKNFGNNGHFDGLLKENNGGSDIYSYICPFQIDNQFYGEECHFECDFATKVCNLTYDSPVYCERDVGGIDVVYRVIELNKDTTISFPGIVGTGRKLGENWATFVSNRYEKFANVMNYKNIYEKEPIYSIDLTPELIQQIRADNAEYRKHKMDPYTVMRYTDRTQKIVCEDNSNPSNQTCASKWLSKLSQDKILTGIYGSITDTNERLRRIRDDKNSNAASGSKAVATGGA